MLARLGVVIAFAGCSFEGPSNAAVADAAAIDARLAACASNGDYVADPISGISLRLLTTGLDLDAAMTACAADEARLAVLDTTDKITFADSLTESGRTYLGLTDLDVEGEWRWSDNSLATLEQPPWAGGRPDGDTDQGCGTLRGDGLLDDEPCEEDRDVLCECAD